MRVHGGLWFAGAARRRRGRSGPTPYDEPTHPFPAQAVLDGRVTHASREDLRATVAVRARSDGPVAALPRPRTVEGAPDDARGGSSPWWRAASATREPPDDAEARPGRCAPTVRAEVRDAVLYAVPRESAVAHLGLGRPAAPGPARPVPDAAAVAAFSAWLAGDGALAWCALDRCLEATPTTGSASASPSA